MVSHHWALKAGRVSPALAVAMALVAIAVGMFNTGNPGLFRLFNEPLGGQIVWLLPMALLGMLALAWQWSPGTSDDEPLPDTPRGKLTRLWRKRPRFQQDLRLQSLILWGVWLLTVAIFFSAASFFHQYYLSTFAPGHLRPLRYWRCRYVAGLQTLRLARLAATRGHSADRFGANPHYHQQS